MSKRESVWDYPRPPRVEAVTKPIRIEFGGQVIAETTRAYRVLETSHPPVYYIPREDVSGKLTRSSTRNTYCEWKGVATYWSVEVSGEGEGHRTSDAAWSYEEPTASFAMIQGYLAFYAAKMQACYVDGERVAPQEGSFYGGWITSDLILGRH